MRGHDYEAISAGQKAEFGIMVEKQSTLHPRHGSIDCVNLKLCIIQISFIIPLFVRETSVSYATKKVTAPLTLLAVHVCVSTAEYQSISTFAS